MKENGRADAKEEKKKNEDENNQIVLKMEKAEITYCSLIVDSSVFFF